LETLCISRGITMPRLKVTEDSALNAFASGLNEKQYSITVTQGLLDHLDDKEIEAVLGHELTHIRNGDVRMLVIAVIIAGVIGFFAELVFRMFFQGWGWGRGSRSRSRRTRRTNCRNRTNRSSRSLPRPDLGAATRRRPILPRSHSCHRSPLSHWAGRFRPGYPVPGGSRAESREMRQSLETSHPLF